LFVVVPVVVAVVVVPILPVTTFDDCGLVTESFLQLVATAALKKMKQKPSNILCFIHNVLVIKSYQRYLTIRIKINKVD